MIWSMVIILKGILAINEPMITLNILEIIAPLKLCFWF